MNKFGFNDSEYDSIVTAIFNHDLRKRSLIAQWKILKDYLITRIGDSEKESKMERIEEKLCDIKREEDNWSHLKNCIYLKVFPYIPQIDYVNRRA